MVRSSFKDVWRFVFVTWIFYLGIFLFIGAIAGPVRREFGDIGQEISALIAGVLMLAPFIVLWDWYVLERYYPSRVKELSKREASQPHPQSA